jgi:sulfatase modifying factor 1
MIDPFNTSDPVGTLYFDTDGERVPLRGGAWGNASAAGLGYLILSNVRSYSFASVGFFPAFVS